MSHRRLPSRASLEADSGEGGIPMRKQSAVPTEMPVELTEGTQQPPQQQQQPPRQQLNGQHDPETPNTTAEFQAKPPEAPRGLITRKRTLIQILFIFLPRFLLTLTIALSIYGVLAHYTSIEVMSQADKRGFNTIITGLSIVQGLVLVGSLNAMVGDLRWWVLSRRFRSRRKVERILRAESILQLVNLARKSARPSIYFGVILWLLVIAASQIAVASLNLLYATGAADTWPLMVNGDISIADVSTIYTDKVVNGKSRTLGAQQYTANSYGIVSLAFSIAYEDNLFPIGTIFLPGEPFMYYSNSSNSYRYIFRETSSASLATAGPWAVAVISPRSVRSTATCTAFPVLAGGNGTQTSLLIAGEKKGDEPRNVRIPFAGGTDQTTYFTNTTEDCGEGCSPVTAFETTSAGAWYYQCNVTVDPVANATRPEHMVSAEVAKLASSAIALQGYGVSSMAKNNITQFQSYPVESVFGSTANGSVADLANMLSRFTTGVVAAVAEGNPTITIKNVQAPDIGVSLEVSHPGMVVLILVGVVVLQLLLEILVAVLSNRVIVPPRGAVTTAQVLRAMTMDEMSIPADKSSLWTRKVGHGPEGGRGRWRYRVDPVAGQDVFDLGMEKEPQ